jgi:hypothetical protein
MLGAEALLADPLPLPEGLGAMAGGCTTMLGTPNRYTRDLDPAVTVLAASLVNCHAAII